VEFFDVNVANKSRTEMHAQLSELLKDVIASKDQYQSLIEYDKAKIQKGALNPGCAVTQQIKDVSRYTRSVGVHVSPTVYLDGVEQKEVSSGWTIERWDEFLNGKTSATT
jgi:protein-disulfide isomerase